MTHDHDPDFTNPKLNGATPMSDAEKIAEVLAAHACEYGDCGQCGAVDNIITHQAEMVAEALKPANVERDAEVAAKTLEDAADDLAKLANITAATSSWMIVDSLRLRAGRLREKP